jgi:hypothetical protein
VSVVVANSVFAHDLSDTPQASLSVTGSDRCLFVALKVTGGPTVASPQVDGFALTPIYTNPDWDIYTYLYVAPATGTRTVQMTATGGGDWAMFVAALTGVHQSSPVGTAVPATNSEVTSISQSVTGVADGLVMDFAFMVSGAITPGAGQTRFPTSVPNGDLFNDFSFSAGISSKSGSGSVSTSWNCAASGGDSYLVVIPFLPSAGGGGGNVSNQNLLLMGIG